MILPYCEQHEPKVEPKQVTPFPHEASVETFRLGVEDAEEEVFDVDVVVEVLVLEVVGFEELVVDVFEVDDVFDDDDVQTPNAGWHPVAQYALVVPHQPYWEQQLPAGQT